MIRRSSSTRSPRSRLTRAARPAYAVFCDSLEVGGEDWSVRLSSTNVRERRGYDLRPWLPALGSDIGDKTADIRHDWGRTLTELFNDYFATAGSRGGPGRAQDSIPHPGLWRRTAGGPLQLCLSPISVEGEGFHLEELPREPLWAASASHLLGRPVTSSETWTWLHQAVFLATPLDMKAEADMHFLQGINQLIGHGWPYTAEGIEYPGWRFYASAVFNEKNPWWIVMPDVSLYLQRLSHIL